MNGGYERHTKPAYDAVAYERVFGVKPASTLEPGIIDEIKAKMDADIKGHLRNAFDDRDHSRMGSGANPAKIGIGGGPGAKQID